MKINEQKCSLSGLPAFLLCICQNLGNGSSFPHHALCPSLHQCSLPFSVDSQLPWEMVIAQITELNLFSSKIVLDNLVGSELQYCPCYL